MEKYENVKREQIILVKTLEKSPLIMCSNKQPENSKISPLEIIIELKPGNKTSRRHDVRNATTSFVMT